MRADEDAVLRSQVNAVVINLDDASFVTKEGTLHADGLVTGVGGNGNDVGKTLRILVLDFVDLQAALLGKAWCIDIVDGFFHLGVQHALDYSSSNHLGIYISNLAVVGDFQLLDGTVSQGAYCAAQTLSQLEVRRDDIHNLLGNRCHIYSGHDRLAVEGSLDALCHIYGNTDLCLYGGSTQMRGYIDAGNPQQRVVSRDRLAGEYIHSSACYLAGQHCLTEVGLVDDAATGAIHQAHALLHAGHDILVDHVAGSVGERHVHGDEIGFLYNLVKGAYSHAHVLAAFLVDIWVVADDFHIKGQGALCHAAADTAHADNAQGFALQLNACVLLAVPLALLEGFVGNRYMARHSHHHGTGMLGGSNGVAARGVDNNNALVGSGSNINVVHAYTGTADNL